MTLESLKSLCTYLDNPADMAPYLTPWRGAEAGTSPLILFPTSTQQVAKIMKTAVEHRIPLVPQGGNTGLVQGTLTHGEVIVNLSRMNRIRAIDTDGYTLTVEAGCILKNVQEEARKHNRLFPLSMASEGSCEIGGNLATNAGGINVLHYGTTRELCLGIEAVLPDGSIYEGLAPLRKDNTGYDLKSLLIGSEGTLGLITAATFKLFPLPAQKATAFLAVPSAEAALALLTLFRERSGDRITAFEYIADSALQLVLKHIPGTRLPVAPSPAYVLVELADCGSGENILAEAFERNLVTDGALAESLGHAAEFWKLRESISEAARGKGHGLHFDIAVPVAALPEFLAKADSVILSIVEGSHAVGDPSAAGVPPSAQDDKLKFVTFGHFGDGNLHYNLLLPDSSQDAAIKREIHSVLEELKGSISAEHGIGLLKKADLHDAPKLAAMRAIKQALDPLGLLNPGKVL